MKNLLKNSAFLLAFASMIPLTSQAQTVFSDNFSSGSTVNNASPTGPTSTSTDYQIVSAKGWNPTPSVSPGDLQFGIGSTSGGIFEAQALFANSPVNLNVGDSLRLTLTFTDTSGVLLTHGFFGIGMYNSGGSGPVAGGLNGTESDDPGSHSADGVAGWQGYVAQIGNLSAGDDSQIMTRPSQLGLGITSNQSQDLVTSGSGSQSYLNSSTVGSKSTGPSQDLVAGNVYTEDLMFTLTASGLQIDNNLYNGSAASGSPISTMTATDGSPLATSFDGLAIGYYAKDSTYANQLDLNSVTVTASAVPEPSSIALMMLGAFGLLLAGRRKLCVR